MRFTAGDLIGAIRKNGYSQTRGDLFKYDGTGRMIGGCAIGQAIANLQEIDTDKANVLRTGYYRGGEYPLPYFFTNLVSEIVGWNDAEGASLEEIARRLEERFTGNYVLFED